MSVFQSRQNYTTEFYEISLTNGIDIGLRIKDIVINFIKMVFL